MRQACKPFHSSAYIVSSGYGVRSRVFRMKAWNPNQLDEPTICQKHFKKIPYFYSKLYAVCFLCVCRKHFKKNPIFFVQVFDAVCFLNIFFFISLKNIFNKITLQVYKNYFKEQNNVMIFCIYFFISLSLFQLCKYT